MSTDTTHDEQRSESTDEQRGEATVRANLLEAEIQDGRVSIGDLVEDAAVHVRTDPDQLVEEFPVAELQLTGEDIEAHVHLNAEAVAEIRDALAEVDPQ